MKKIKKLTNIVLTVLASVVSAINNTPDFKRSKVLDIFYFIMLGIMLIYGFCFVYKFKSPNEENNSNETINSGNANSTDKKKLAKAILLALIPVTATGLIYFFTHNLLFSGVGLIVSGFICKNLYQLSEKKGINRKYIAGSIFGSINSCCNGLFWSSIAGIGLNSFGARIGFGEILHDSANTSTIDIIILLIVFALGAYNSDKAMKDRIAESFAELFENKQEGKQKDTSNLKSKAISGLFLIVGIGASISIASIEKLFSSENLNDWGLSKNSTLYKILSNMVFVIPLIAATLLIAKSVKNVVLEHFSGKREFKSKGLKYTFYTLAILGSAPLFLSSTGTDFSVFNILMVFKILTALLGVFVYNTFLYENLTSIKNNVNSNKVGAGQANPVPSKFFEKDKKGSNQAGHGQNTYPKDKRDSLCEKIMTLLSFGYIKIS